MDTLEAILEIEGMYEFVQAGIFSCTGLQIIIGNARVQMVDVVKTNVAGQPLEHPWQFVKSAALNGGRQKIPLLLRPVIILLVLVLYVEKPEGDRPEAQQYGKMYQENLLPAQDKGKSAVDQHQKQVIEKVGPPDPFPLLQPHERITHGKGQVNHGHAYKLNDRAAKEAVVPLPPRRTLAVLFRRQEIDVAPAAVLQLAIMGVMFVVAMAPVLIRNGTEQAGEKADHLVPLSGLQKGLMPAIVLDDKDTHEKKSSYDRQRKGKEVRPLQADVHQNQQAEKR